MRRHGAMAPGIQDDPILNNVSAPADHSRVMGDLERFGQLSRPIQVQSAKAPLIHSLQGVLCKVIAKPSFAQAALNLGVVNDRRIGDPVLLRKLKRIVVGDTGCARGLSRIYSRSQFQNRLSELAGS